MAVRLPLRLLACAAAVVVIWGAVHVATTRSLSPQPLAWPSAQPAPTAPALRLPVAPATPGAAAGEGAVPVLPGALRQLDGSTRDTAVGLYRLIQQLESALGGQLKQLAQQLEPGR